MNNIELKEFLEKAGLTEKEINGIDKFDLELIEEARKDDYEIVIYRDIEELGENNSDSGLYEENDTYESFGMFLLNNYKNNYSSPKDICFELNSGRIVQMG